jgi:hypothetical protein
MKTFLGNDKAENYHEIVSDLFTAYKPMGCNMSLKVYFLGSHLDFFPENLGAVSDEHGERFHRLTTAGPSREMFHRRHTAGNQPQLLFR